MRASLTSAGLGRGPSSARVRPSSAEGRWGPRALLRTFERWLRRFAVPLTVSVACFAVAFSAPSRDDLRSTSVTADVGEEERPSRFAAELAEESGAGYGAAGVRDVPSGRLRIPVEGVAPEDLMDTYDDPRSGGRTHRAIDIMASRGTAVVAAASGTVATLFRSKLGGLSLYVYPSGGGEVHYYAHMDSYAAGLEEGERVRAGQVLGTVGSTGNAPEEAPHLHFAIHRLEGDERWWQGEPMDPLPRLLVGASPGEGGAD